MNVSRDLTVSPHAVGALNGIFFVKSCVGHILDGWMDGWDIVLMGAVMPHRIENQLS